AAAVESQAHADAPSNARLEPRDARAGSRDEAVSSASSAEGRPPGEATGTAGAVVAVSSAAEVNGALSTDAERAAVTETGAATGAPSFVELLASLTRLANENPSQTLVLGAVGGVLVVTLSFGLVAIVWVT